MVRAGMAIATTPGPGEPDYTGIETEAVTSGAGLWAPDACSGGPIDDISIDRDRSVVDPAGPDGEHLGEEAILITNQGDKKVNLNGWKLRDESSRHRYTFSSGTQIEPGQTMVITSADDGWEPGGSPVWSNDGDIVMVLDRHGRVVDHWRYPTAGG